MIEVLARDQLLDAIPDEDLQGKVRQSRPPTLRQALAVSLELESICLASKQRLHTVREAALEEEGSEDEQPDQPHHKIIHHQTELVRCAMREPRQVKMQGEQHTSCGQRTVACWHCGKKGHVWRECPTTESLPQGCFPAGKWAVAEVMGQSSATSTEAPKVVFKTGSIHNACDV